jgi:hypothetical protein
VIPGHIRYARIGSLPLGAAAKLALTDDFSELFPNVAPESPSKPFLSFPILCRLRYAASAIFQPSQKKYILFSYVGQTTLYRFTLNRIPLNDHASEPWMAKKSHLKGLAQEWTLSQ